ncbi:MAG: RNA methyltransferase [Porphyromonadaceae bacterium]|nr:MAG: RNA methyltransferase [Porphyromonadaceae bacterium]
MITKAQIQFIRSLEQKKVRDESGCFIAEGDKLVREAIELPPDGSFQVRTICGVESWLDSNLSGIRNPEAEVIPVSDRELERISLQKAPNQVLAVISRYETTAPVFDFNSDLLIGLNQVQDPGNVGTIVRLADWFGLDGIIASVDSADFFSPKVVQSSMGSIFRLKLLTTDLYKFIKSLPLDCPVYGTHLDGQNLYTAKLTSNGLILLGNESRGLSTDLTELTTENLLIPDFSEGKFRPESLNVSIAAAIVCSEFRRRGNGEQNLRRTLHP